MRESTEQNDARSTPQTIDSITVVFSHEITIAVLTTW